MPTLNRGRGWSFFLAPALLLLALAAFAPGCSSTTGDDNSDDSSAEAADGNNGSATEKASLDGENDKEGEEKDKEIPVPVEVAVIERGDIESFIRSTANLEAEHEVKVFSQAARLVVERRVEEGDEVREGDLLLRLQDDEQRSALAKAENEYNKATREYERQKRLYEKQLISEETFNNATYNVEQLRISVEDTKRELSYTGVRAPFSGTITGRHVNIGDTVTNGQHLFDLVDFDSIVARIYIPEKELPRLRVGQSAWVTAQGLGAEPRTGAVSRISPIVDARTGTVKVTVALKGRHSLRPGMYADVKLVTDIHQETVLVPKRALVYDQDQIFVYRLAEERRVERMLIAPILEDKEFVEPANGFAPGDQIIVAGQAGLKDKALVRLPGDPDPDDEEEDEDEEDDGTQVAEAP